MMAVEFASNKLFINAAMNTSFESDVIPLERKKGYSIRVDHDGDAIGVFYIAESIDNEQWLIKPDSTREITEPGSVTYNVNETNFQYTKLCYLSTSGNGLASAKFNCKGGH